MKVLKGIIPILQTPFSEDGREVAYDDLSRLTELMIREGADAVALFGIASEFYKLSDKEKEGMMKTVVKTVNGRVPVIASITRNSTELAIQDAALAQEIGVDALMMFSPHFLKPSTHALKEHILTVANSVDLPFIIQYTPSVGGGTLDVESVIELAGMVKNRLYMKVEVAPPAPFVELLHKMTHGELGIFTGNAGLQMLDLMDRGATGIMPGCSMIKAYVAFYQSHVSGQLDQAKKIYDTMVPMILLVNQAEEMFIKYEKMILHSRGIFKTDYCRKPTDFPCDAKIWTDYQKYRSDLDKLISLT